jgi:hypothetical protein
MIIFFIVLRVFNDVGMILKIGQSKMKEKVKIIDII